MSGGAGNALARMAAWVHKRAAEVVEAVYH